MFAWKERLGEVLTKGKDFYTEHPNVFMFGAGFISASLLAMLVS